MTEFDAVKDSGERTNFSTGSRRDVRTGKGRYDLIPPYFVKRLAQHLENGAVKYGDRNWELGQPLSVYLDSALRHLFNVADMQVDEDHPSAAVWNVMAFINTVQQIQEGLLPEELDDIHYLDALWDVENGSEPKDARYFALYQRLEGLREAAEDDEDDEDPDRLPDGRIYIAPLGADPLDWAQWKELGFTTDGVTVHEQEQQGDDNIAPFAVDETFTFHLDYIDPALVTLFYGGEPQIPGQGALFEQPAVPTDDSFARQWVAEHDAEHFTPLTTTDLQPYVNQMHENVQRIRELWTYEDGHPVRKACQEAIDRDQRVDPAKLGLPREVTQGPMPEIDLVDPSPPSGFYVGDQVEAIGDISGNKHWLERRRREDEWWHWSEHFTTPHLARSWTDERVAGLLRGEEDALRDARML